MNIVNNSVNKRTIKSPARQEKNEVMHSMTASIACCSSSVLDIYLILTDMAVTFLLSVNLVDGV